ncbi:hypothetical protein ACHHYP_07239 [Achlya hypogyna]|uniref:Transmembrane protein n=1 Tax=Achlya hypogyna TaxID=1202772 RepID=A0A1V9ZMF2_ACHHY|nr:hypothetical protein ACHHYP_07239 [Achlya hypogyna]
MRWLAFLATTLALAGAQRRLAAPGMSFVTNSSMAGATTVGKNVLESIQNLRGGSPAFYESLYTALQIMYCDYLCNSDGHSANAEVDAVLPASIGDTVPPYIRFVPKGHALALKDANNSCVLLANPPKAVAAAYEAGYCEVIANCYWTPLQHRDASDRTPVYSVRQAVLPPSTSMTLAQAKSTLQKWAQGVAYFVAPAVIIGVVCFLACLLFLFCRCCCNRCGGRNPKPTGYTSAERGIPIGFFVLFAGAISGLAVVSLLYYNIIADSVTNTFTLTLSTIADLEQWVGTIVKPLEHLRDSVLASADSVSEKLNNTDFIATGLTGIVSELQAFDNATFNVTLPKGCVLGKDLICIPCDVCTTVNTQVTEAVSQMQSVAGTGIATLQTTRCNRPRLQHKELTSHSSALLSTLVASKTTIKDTVNTAVASVAVLSTMTGNMSTQISTYEATWKEQSLARQAGILVLFVLAVVVVVVGLLGICLGLTPLRCLAIVLHAAYLLGAYHHINVLATQLGVGFVTLLLTFILAAIFIAVSILMGDVCQLTLLLARDWSPVLGQTTGDGINACFRNESLIDALGMRSSVAFASDVSFPTLDVSAMLSFGRLDSFAATILAANTSTFDMDPNVFSTLLSALNDLTSASYLATNQPAAAATCNVADGDYSLTTSASPWFFKASSAIADPVPFVEARYQPYSQLCAGVVHPNCGHDKVCNYDAFLTEIVANMSALVRVTRDASTFVDDMHTSMYHLGNSTALFQTRVTNLSNTLTDIGANLQTSLIRDVRAFEKAMNCTFVAHDYSEFYVQLCGTVTPALLMISLCLFLMGVFLIPIIVTLIILTKRLRAPQTTNVMPDTTLK